MSCDIMKIIAASLFVERKKKKKKEKKKEDSTFTLTIFTAICWLIDDHTATSDPCPYMQGPIACGELVTNSINFDLYPPFCLAETK